MLSVFWIEVLLMVGCSLMNNKILLYSPVTGIGGIVSWTNNMLYYIKERDINYVIHLDSAKKNRGRNDASRNYLKRIIFGIIDTPKLVFEFIYMIKKEKPSIVHSTCSGSLGFLREIILLFISKRLGIRHIVHLRFGRMPKLCKQRNWEYFMLRKVVDYSSRTIVIDKSSFNALSQCGFSLKISLIPNPCAVYVENIAKKARDIEPSNGRYLFVGHVVKEKGIYELIDAFCKTSYELNLDIIGPYENSVKNELLLLAKNKDNGRWLNFIGPLCREEILFHMNNSLALVLPTYTEGFPNVVLEAMACGCPILASNVGAIPEMLNIDDLSTQCGICFNPQSTENLLKAIEDFQEDVSLRKKFSLNGKLKVLSSYTMDIVFAKYKELWYN